MDIEKTQRRRPERFPFALATAFLCFASALIAPVAAVPPGNGGNLLPSGYLSAKGSRIVDSAGKPVRIASVGWQGSNNVDGTPFGLWSVNYKVTMDAMVQDGFNCFRLSWTDDGLHSANICKSIDYTFNPDLAGLTQMQVIDKIVAYAGQNGLKVILDHHSDEGLPPDEGQQANGLWYDLGPGADGTDGAGNPGTVTSSDFQADWLSIASRYAGNATVIGFDIDNEPHGAWSGASNGLNWGNGGPEDIWAMYTNVGNSIQAIDHGALIICEGPMDITDKSSIIWWNMNLTHVASKPVVLNIPNKVVYSVHEYPTEVSAVPNDSGLAYVARMNEDWGYLVSRGIAPVWVGEMGAPLGSSDTDGNTWIASLLPYINGRDGSQGGPVFHGSDQPISTDWWYWGTLNYNGVPGGDGWGTLSNWNPTTFVPYQQAVTDQLLWLSTPSISSISKTTMAVGDSFTISGGNFYCVENIILDGNASATFTVNSPTSISVTIPANARSGPIRLTTPGGTATSTAVLTIE